jgi:hypothetical protein
MDDRAIILRFLGSGEARQYINISHKSHQNRRYKWVDLKFQFQLRFLKNSYLSLLLFRLDTSLIASLVIAKRSHGPRNCLKSRNVVATEDIHRFPVDVEPKPKCEVKEFR